MKVLFVCPFVPWPLVNGGKIRTYNLLRSASEHVEIHLRLVREPDMAEDAEEALAPWCASVRTFDRARAGSLARWMRPKLERWFHSPALIESVRAELASGGFQLVHLDELLLARILPAGRHVPLVQHHHKLDTVLYGRLNGARGARRHFDLWKLRRLETESARRYRHHLLCSWEDAEVLRTRHGALDCAVVPSGFDPDYFHPPDEDPAPRAADRLVFVGSMDYGPNVDGITWFVRNILPRIHARRPAVTVEVVGGNPAREVRALESEHVHVTGRVADVRPHLWQAAASIVPLNIGGGTRLKIVESLGCDTPVVSTPIGAEGLGLVHERHILLGDGAEGFANACLRALEQPDERARCVQAGRKHVLERFSWKNLAEELVDYWERVAFSGALSPSR